MAHMGSPENEIVKGLFGSFKRFYGIDIHFIGRLPTEESGDTPAWLVSIISELVHNSPPGESN